MSKRINHSEENKIASTAPKMKQESLYRSQGRTKRIKTSDILQDLRDKAKKNLSLSSVNDDLDFIVQSVRSLIVTNEEIWDRCNQGGICETTEYGSPIIMTKFCYEKAVVEQLMDKYKLEITTQLNFVFKDFGLLPVIPSVLTNIMVAPDGNDLLPDYDAYFNKAGLLEEGVLVVFLNQMQKHLEDVQVYLGKIDEWLSDSESIIEFLNGLFGTDLKAGSSLLDEEMDELTEENSCTSNTPDNPRTSICTKCLSDVSKHSRTKKSEVWRFRVTNFRFTPSSSTDDSSYEMERRRRIRYMMNDWGGNRPRSSICRKKTKTCPITSYQCSDGESASFFSPPRPAKIFCKDQVSNNEMKITFDLRNEVERKKLQTFITFIQM